MKEGFITVISGISEIGWRGDSGPVFYDTKQEAEKCIAEDMIEFLTQVSQGERELDDVPDTDEVAYCKQINEYIYQVYDLSMNEMFTWDIRNT